MIVLTDVKLKQGLYPSTEFSSRGYIQDLVLFRDDSLFYLYDISNNSKKSGIVYNLGFENQKS